MVASAMTFMTQMSVGQLRLMTASDIEDASGLSTAAGWNQSDNDWRRLLECAPRGCFGIEVEGNLVASTTAVCYQRDLAWIGMVLTHPEYRGRGFAGRLLAQALEFTEAAGIRTIKLDATGQGRPLYEKFKFVAEQPVERWIRSGSGDATPSNSSAPLESSLFRIDREAFGADRSELLCALGQHSAINRAPDAFLFSRPGRVANYLGPCVARDSQTAQQMIREAITQAASASWYWDLLPENKEAVALANDLGFRPQRFLTRMTRGKALHGRDSMIYAIAGFELG
jgi:GNAT superfamily N-acetyltransferase